MPAFICEVSGKEYDNEPVIIVTHDGKKIGPDEAEANWFKSDYDGEYYPASDKVEVRNEDGDESFVTAAQVRSNYRRCEHSNHYYPHTRGYRVNGYGWVSDYELDHSGDFFCCDSCGEWFHNDDHAEEGVCIHCHEENSEEDGILHDHGNRSYPPFRGKGPLYYGVELEVECGGGSDRRALIEGALDLLTDRFVIMKEDGSLTHGFEIVTCPATFEEQKKGWEKFLANRSRKLRSWNTDTCGMHIHVSRAALSQLQIGKLLVFINLPENKDFVETMAGRSESSWAKMSKKKLTDVKLRNPDRYQAINLQNAKTIEFRIFKGTLNPERFLANLEFVDALVKFTVPGSRSYAAAADSKEFLKFAFQNKKTYPNLFARLVKSNYLPAPKPRTDIPQVTPVAALDTNVPAAIVTE